jgi:uncharacterized protein (TIGR03086 family)
MDTPDHSPAARFRRVAATFTDLAAATPGDAWERPAPCDGWTARDIVRHMVEWIPSVIGRAGISFDDGPAVDVDPAGAWRHLAHTLQAALDDPTTASRSFDVGPPGEMTVEAAINLIVLGDVFIHCWDLAVATGQTCSLDATMATEMYIEMQQMDDMLRASGHFAPRVHTDSTDPTVRLIAFTGRDPNWSRA